MFHKNLKILHLSNVETKLGKQPKKVEMLKNIVIEWSQTASSLT